MDILIRPLTGSRLIRDYQSGEESAVSFYRGSATDIDTYRTKAAEVDLRFTPEMRRRVAGLVRAPSPAAAAKLEAVVAGYGLIVTTGQQPGLFTGPLYTIHKLLSAVRLAAALERALDRPVLPLFWVASDDHDWEEANHTFVLDRRNDLHRIELPGEPGAAPASMRHRSLGPAVEASLDRFIRNLPTTEFAGDILDRLRAAYRPDTTVAEAFTELLEQIAAPLGAAIVDGGQGGIKIAAAELLSRELRCSAEHEAILHQTARALDDAGYHAQVPVLAGATNVLYEDEHGRERLFRDGGDFVLRGSGRRFSRARLFEMLAESPERFSANVALRPVVESAIFPTVAYVGGPAEVSYFGQIRPLFEAHGIGMPAVFPRFSVLLVESKIRKVLDRFDLDPDDFRKPSHELAARVLRQELPADVKLAIAELRQALDSGYARLADAAREIDPTLDGPLLGARNHSQVRLSDVEKKITRHLKMRNDLGLDQLDKARANLYPNGAPQERVLNVHQYLVRHGDELLAEIAERMEVHWNAAASPVV